MNLRLNALYDDPRPSDTQPDTQAGNGQMPPLSLPTRYAFEGNTYKTREQAEAARQDLIRQNATNADLIARANADLAYAGYDYDKYTALRNSNGLLSQMSDEERSFISKRYQASNPYDRKAYTDSAVDQYLASVGLPAQKELTNYRKAYYDYASGGGVAENYSGLDDDSFRYISRHWKDGMQTGVDGKLYTAKGKEVAYKDTMLDEQLQSLGLPPSSLMNDYFLDYQQDKKVDAEITDFYAAVYNKANGGMPSDEAYRATLMEPKYRHLSEYVSEAIAYPNEADYADTDPLSDTYGQTDKAKYEAAWKKSLSADAKRDELDHRVSFADYENYATKELQQRRGQERTERYKAYQENAKKWFTTPASGEEEITKRNEEMSQFLGVFGDGASVSDMNTYFRLLDAGVPYQTLQKGQAAVAEWNEKQNAASPTYADIKLLSQGYSADDGDYAENRKAVYQTKQYTEKPDYDRYKGFDVALYNMQTTAAGRRAAVTPEGAIYAVVNGAVPASADFSNDQELYSLYAFANAKSSNGKRMSDYMTDEEKGVFNYLFRTDIEQSMQYLEGLRSMIEDRQYVDRTGSFAMRMATDGVKVPDDEVASYVYDALLYQKGQELEAGADGWEAEAWRKYSGYSDRELQQRAEEADVDPYLHGPNEAQWVLDTRADLRRSANVEASLYDYTEAAGKAATEEHDYSADIVPPEPEARERTYWERVAGAQAMQPDWSSTIERVRDGGHARDTELPIYQQMTDAQKDRYNWLYKNKGQEAAQAYYASIRPGLDAAAAAETKAENKAFGKEHKALATVLSVPGTFVSGLMGVVGTGLNLATGTELTRTQAASWNASNTWREGVSEDWGKAGQFAYGTVMSMADSGVTAVMAAMGVPPVVGTALLATSAYTATLDAALDRGLDARAAYGTAAVAGFAEWITEEIGLESLLEGIDSLRKGAKTTLTKEYFKNVARQAVVEGSEEVNSDIINFVYDNLVNGDMSEFNQNVKSLVDAGYTQEEARKIAWGNQIKETALSFAGGALSGGIMAGAGGWFGIKPALLDRAFGEISSQEGTSAPAPAQTGTSVHAHADTYAKGRAVVDRIFGQDAGNNILYALDNRETADDAQRIDAISERLANLDSTSYLYGPTHDADGNLTLTDDERVALASALAMGYGDANADNIEAAFTHAMASLQTDQQRQANTNPEWIKTPQEQRNIQQQISKTQEAITAVEQEQAAKLADAQSAYNAAAGEVNAITKKLNAATTVKEKNSLQASLKTALDKSDNLKARLNTVKGTDATNARERIKAAKEEIARQQTLLDRHYASASAFLSEHAPASFSGATVARATANTRMADVGAKIDAIMASDMSDTDRAAALAPLHDQLASAGASLRAISARLDNADPAALSNAMNAMKSGTVADFIRSQNEAAQKAQEAARTSNAGESSSGTENEEGAPSDAVKQDDAKQSAGKDKTTVTIGAKVQKTFDRIAKRFGCEIVWGDDSTAIGETGQTLQGRNGAYNPAEPNRIYLNKTMVANGSLSSTQVVAREFFTHEIVHYVANTKTYGNLLAMAATYYNKEYGAKGGADALVNAIVADEQQRGNTGFGKRQAQEEMVAHFAQEVLFAGADGNRRALVWLARSDSGIVSNFLTTVEYLIKRGNVRRASDANAVKTMLIDAEYELINALKERQYLDAHGMTNAFQRGGNAQAEAQTQADTQEQTGVDTAQDKVGEPQVMNSDGRDISEYLTAQTIRDNCIALQSADPVAHVDGRTFANDGTSLRGRLESFFTEEMRNGVDNPILGNISITRNSFRDDLAHGKTKQKIESYAALRPVLEKGVIIDYKVEKYGLEKIVLAAPITMGDEADLYFMGAMIHRNPQTNRFYMHDVVSVNAVDGKRKSSPDIISDTTSSFTEESASAPATGKLYVSDIIINALNVNPQNMGTPTETLSDVKAIYNRDSNTGVMNSRGTTLEDYLPLDFSKNKLLQKNGKPYEELYSGTPYAGFTIFNPMYADDGLSNFATSSKRIAQSYTWEGDNATEYDPRNADRDREQMDQKGQYLLVDETGQYGKKANGTMLQMLNRMTDWAFDKDNDDMQDLDFAAQSIKDSDLRHEAMQGVEAGSLIQYAASRLASHHSESDFKELQNAYRMVVQANERLMPAAKEELERVRKLYSSNDFRAGSEKPMQDTPLLAVFSYLRTLQTSVEDALLNSGIYDVMRQADAEGATSDKRYVGFDSLYKGKAQLFTEQETWERLPTYEGEPGYYKLKLYAENPLDVDVQDQNWENMDVNAFPSDVREKLAELYGYKLSYKTREVSRAAYETGYDAVVFRGLHDTDDLSMDEASDVIITYKPYQSKSVYNKRPTTNPDIMFSSGMSIDDYVNRYGQKEQNTFGRANNIRTPNNVDNDAGRVFRVSDSAQTLKEVTHIRQAARDVIDEGILQQADGLQERHGLVYEPVTLDRMRELGTQYIADHGGLTQAMRDLTRDMPRARQNELVQYMSAANQVFTEIGAEGTFDPQEYYEFVASYVEMRSNWGRVGRAMQLVNDSPLGRVAYWQRVVQRINEKNSEAVSRGLNPLFYRDGAAAINVPQSFFDSLAQARNQEEIDAAEYAITQYIGQNSPLTVSDALRNWRYFAMLANPVTHMRNLLGNTAMLGGRVVKDTIAAGMENAAVRMGLMGADERTHAVVLGQDADTRAFVRQLWEDNANAVQSGGRDGFQQTLDDARRKSPIRAIDAAMRFNTNGVENSNNPFLRYVGLEKEDLLFLQTTFTAAAAQYIQAQGIDVRNVTRQQRGEIVNYATQQAQEATYRDASKLADALNQFAKSGWGAQLFIDAVVPFKKTPVNIFKRGIEYSPAGLARGLIDIGRNAVARSKGRQPSVRASVVVDELAKGLTGSMLALLGFFLSRAGILKVKAGDDDKDSAFERDIGRQDYSLEIGDVSVKIESLAPLTFPLFMGAQLQRLTSTEHDGLSLSDLAESAATLADPLMDMSFMSSLNDVLSTYNENKLGGVAVNAAQSYLGQYLPTIGAKLNQTINTQRRTSKASQASPVGTSMDYWLRSMASKIPGVNQAVLEPYVTTTGEYDEKSGFGDYALAIINNFVSPVNVQIVDTSPVNEELSRLVTATGSTDFVPQNPKKYLTIKSERYNMTAKEYTQYSKEHNETVYAVLTQVIQSDAYARMTDEQRAEMLSKAYERAHKTVMDKYKAVFAQK